MVCYQEQVVAFCCLCSGYTALYLAFFGLGVRDVIADLIHCKGLVPITHDKVCFRTSPLIIVDVILRTGFSPQQLQNALGTNMEINFFDPYNNDENIRGVWVDGIIESLRRNGLDVGKPVTRPGYEVRQSDNEAIRDLAATARRKTNE